LAVGGAKGVGKTTALKGLQELSPAQVVYVSAELNKFSLTKNSKRLSELHISERDDVRKEYGEGLAEKLTKSSDNKVYVDLHYTDIREDPDKILHPALWNLSHIGCDIASHNFVKKGRYSVFTSVILTKVSPRSSRGDSPISWEWPGRTE